MNAEHLLQHFERISEAPDAIPRLRRFILDLAVRGKLVEQDDNDEPAAELLKRIQAEKQRLIKEGKIKNPKPLPPIKPDELPYELPQRWEWVRLGAIGTIGSSSRVHQKDWTDRGVPFYRAREIVKLSKNGFVNNELFITEELFRALSSKGLTPEAGDIMITGVGTIGVPYVVSDNDRFYFKDASVLIFKNQFNIYPIFLRRFFDSPHWVECIHKDSMGTTVHTLTIVRASEILTPLPPLAEQHRIVAKIDELMALCDQLEASKTEREQSRDRLLAANLHNLNQPADDEEAFREHVRFTFNHLPRLTTRPAHIKQLRQTILNLAVRGHLVPQDINDVDVRVALAEAFEVKLNWVRRSSLPKRALPEAAYLSISPFQLPTNWAFVSFDHLSAPVLHALKAGPFGSALKKDSYIPQGYKVYGQEQVIGQDAKIGDYYISAAKFNQLKSCAVAPGDLLISLVGTIGKVLVLPPGCQEGIINPRLIKLSLNFDLVNPNYVQLLLGSPWVKEFLFAEARGTTMDVLNLSILRSLPVPLPPLAEQHRIVTKVDELMGLCDQLEAQLITTETDSRRLLEAVLHEALAPALEEAA